MSSNAFQSLQQLANIGRVRLAPSAISFHPGGPATHDDTWLPTLNADNSVRLQNCTTGHFRSLTAADVLDCVPNAQAPVDGLQHVQVTLSLRLGMCGTWAGWLN